MPFLDDDGVYMFESMAINLYLTKKYGKDEGLAFRIVRLGTVVDDVFLGVSFLLLSPCGRVCFHLLSPLWCGAFLDVYLLVNR